MAEQDVQMKEVAQKMAVEARVLEKIAKSLEGLPDVATGRRVLVAAGLVSGVYDVDENWRVVVREPKDG